MVITLKSPDFHWATLHVVFAIQNSLLLWVIINVLAITSYEGQYQGGVTSCSWGPGHRTEKLVHGGRQAGRIMDHSQVEAGAKILDSLGLVAALPSSKSLFWLVHENLILSRWFRSYLSSGTRSCCKSTPMPKLHHRLTLGACARIAFV